MKNIKIDTGKFLYEEKGFYFIRDIEGKIQKIEKNKFEHNQIVKSSSKHYSQKSFTRVQEPTYNKVRGWVYVENYIGYNQNSGGCGMWNSEDLYEPLSDPMDILFAEKLRLSERIYELKTELKEKEDKLSKIIYSLSISFPDYTKIIGRCLGCGKYITREDQENVNLEYCKKCYFIKQQKSS